MADMQRVGPNGIYYDQSQGATRVHVTPSGLQQEQAAAGGGATPEFSGSAALAGSFAAEPGRDAAFGGSAALAGSFEVITSTFIDFSGSAALAGSFAAEAGRDAVFGGRAALAGSFEVAANAFPEFSGSAALAGSFLAEPGRAAAFSGSASLAGSFAVGNTAPPSFSGSAALAGSFAAEPGRDAAFSASVALAGSFEVYVAMPPATLHGGDATHIVTDGPRIIAGVLDAATTGAGVGGSGYGTVNEAGRLLYPTSAVSTESRFIIFGDISDKRYFEATVEGGLAPSPSGQTAGFCPNDFSPQTNAVFGNSGDPDAIGIGSDGSVYQAGVAQETTPGSVSLNSVLMCAIDPTLGANGTVWFGVDGTWIDGGDPAAGTGGFALSAGHTYRPIMSGYGASGAYRMRVNAGQRPFAHTLPAGFAGLGAFP